MCVEECVSTTWLIDTKLYKYVGYVNFFKSVGKLSTDLKMKRSLQRKRFNQVMIFFFQTIYNQRVTKSLEKLFANRQKRDFIKRVRQIERWRGRWVTLLESRTVRSDTPDALLSL